jgi:peptide deformylase
MLDEMKELMKAENGIGLAANQTGHLLRAFVMIDQKGKLWEFVNPEIIDKDGTIQINEGCLSAPGVFVQVPRAQTITVKALDRNGQEFTVICQDVEAVCVQHEIDHLDGIFYLEKTSRNQRRLAMKQLGLK